MKLYAFDGVDDRFELLPLAARRALDLTGLHLGLEGFLSLPRDERARLAELGSTPVVDLPAVRALVLAASPAPTPCPVLADPSPDTPPTELVVTLGEARPLTDKTWQALDPLGRYVLAKVAARGKAERIAGAYEEVVGATALSTHLGPSGDARMVDVGSKPETRRRALAETWITMSQSAFSRLTERSAPKGDVLGVARIAGIQGAKRTSDLIPLCHPLALSRIDVNFEEQPQTARLRVLCAVEVVGPTGVEMEALTGASVAALTVYDMLKSLDRGMSLGPLRLLEKSGGQSGDFRQGGDFRENGNFDAPSGGGF